MKRGLAFAGVIISMLVIFFIFHSGTGLFTKVERDFWGDKEKLADEVIRKFSIDKEDSVLYLDAGEAPYLFMVNSSCRYPCALPVQRDRPNWNLSGNPAYQEEYDCIMNYSGKYIIADGWDGWFGEDTERRQPIMHKIDSEYELVWKDAWRIYRRK